MKVWGAVWGVSSSFFFFFFLSVSPFVSEYNSQLHIKPLSFAQNIFLYIGQGYVPIS